MRDIIIKTPCGEVKGIDENKVYIFQGIRYAQTPLFEPPVETKSWDGVFDATENGADCYQYSSFNDESDDDSFYYKEFRSEGLVHSYTGDYVTLNIVAPKNASKLPVLVFIHGGGHETGTVGELPYGKCSAYAKHDIVFVSIGYRLNVFSAFDCRNLGLRDQLCALSWLKNNIEAFGGDPEEITAMGQSAGAMSLSVLCCSELSRGLIKGAIMMSGAGVLPSFMGSIKKSKGRSFWKSVMYRAGVDSEEELKNIPQPSIWKAWSEVRADKNLRKVGSVRAMRSGWPGIDGVVLKDSPKNVVKAHKQLDVPYMLGVTSQDVVAPILYSMALKWGKEQHKAKMQPAYGYLFDRAVPGDCFKAWHASDLWYMFGNMDKSWRPFEKVDYELSEQMIAYVANFVKTGDPNGEGLPEWRPIGAAKHNFRHFDGSSSTGISPRACRIKTVHSMLSDRGPL